MRRVLRREGRFGAVMGVKEEAYLHSRPRIARYKRPTAPLYVGKPGLRQLGFREDVENADFAFSGFLKHWGWCLK